VCESSVPTCCRLDFLFRAEFAMHRSLSAAIPARYMVITYLTPLSSRILRHLNDISRRYNSGTEIQERYVSLPWRKLASIDGSGGYVHAHTSGISWRSRTPAQQPQKKSRAYLQWLMTVTRCVSCSRMGLLAAPGCHLRLGSNGRCELRRATTIRLPGISAQALIEHQQAE
jgi:hypothetical protein